MMVRTVRVLFVVLGFCLGCTPVSTPTPIPMPVPSPTATPSVDAPTGVLPTPVGKHFAPADVPACKDAQILDQPVEFSWAGKEDVAQNVPEANWTFYRCGQSPAAVSAFYKRWLPEARYHWAQEGWEQRDGATMGVFFSNTGNPADPNRWLYLWFLPDSSRAQSSYLVAAWSLAPKTC